MHRKQNQDQCSFIRQNFLYRIASRIQRHGSLNLQPMLLYACQMVLKQSLD